MDQFENGICLPVRPWCGPCSTEPEGTRVGGFILVKSPFDEKKRCSQMNLACSVQYQDCVPDIWMQVHVCVCCLLGHWCPVRLLKQPRAKAVLAQLSQGKATSCEGLNGLKQRGIETGWNRLKQVETKCPEMSWNVLKCHRILNFCQSWCHSMGIPRFFRQLIPTCRRWKMWSLIEACDWKGSGTRESLGISHLSHSDRNVMECQCAKCSRWIWHMFFLLVDLLAA